MLSELEPLCQKIARLPGLGPRSARRIVLHLIKNQDVLLKPILHEFSNIIHKLKTCENCHSLSFNSLCEICEDPVRNSHLLCIVSDISDIWAIERTGVYNGRYHVLGGILSAVNGIGPDNLNTETLLNRIAEGIFDEAIIALNSTLDGQVTVCYLTDLLKPYNIKITTLAKGMPLGGELDYTDDGTISMAFEHRVG